MKILAQDSQATQQQMLAQFKNVDVDYVNRIDSIMKNLQGENHDK